jgi:hypothetical protein
VWELDVLEELDDEELLAPGEEFIVTLLRSKRLRSQERNPRRKNRVTPKMVRITLGACSATSCSSRL